MAHNMKPEDMESQTAQGKMSKIWRQLVSIVRHIFGIGEKKTSEVPDASKKNRPSRSGELQGCQTKEKRCPSKPRLRVPYIAHGFSCRAHCLAQIHANELKRAAEGLYED